MVELEQRFLNTPTYSLMFLYTELSRFDDLLEFLLHFIAGIRTERLVYDVWMLRVEFDWNCLHFELLGCMVVRCYNMSIGIPCTEIDRSPKPLKCKST